MKIRLSKVMLCILFMTVLLAPTVIQATNYVSSGIKTIDGVDLPLPTDS